jgi:hypothetical protein
MGLSARIRDGSVTVKMIKAFLSAGQVVNRIMLRIHVRFCRERSGLEENSKLANGGEISTTCRRCQATELLSQPGWLCRCDRIFKVRM